MSQTETLRRQGRQPNRVNARIWGCSRWSLTKQARTVRMSQTETLTFLPFRCGFGLAAFLGDRFLASCRCFGTCRLFLLPTECLIPTARILLAGSDSNNTHDLIPFFSLAEYSARHINRRFQTWDTPLRFSETTWSSPSVVEGQVPPDPWGQAVARLAGLVTEAGQASDGLSSVADQF